MSANHFEKFPVLGMKRTNFPLSRRIMDTFNMDYLVPVHNEEVYGNDVWRIEPTVFGRFSTLLNPIIDNVHIECDWYFVPWRLVWENWKKFNGERKRYSDKIDDMVIPQMKSGSTGWPKGSLQDHLGLPVGISNLSVSVLYARVYELIYNDVYRDQDLIDEVTIAFDDNSDETKHFDLFKSNKKRDYFTTMRPQPQKGEEVSIPLGAFADVVSNDQAPNFKIGDMSNIELKVADGTSDFPSNAGPHTYEYDLRTQPIASTHVSGSIYVPNVAVNNRKVLGFGDETGLKVDLSTAKAISINALREANQIQMLLELNARGGTRYNEILYTHRNVIPEDMRMQRPEWIGGFSTLLNVNTVANTTGKTGSSPTDVGRPQASLAAFGTFSYTGKAMEYHVKEGGCIMGIMRVVPDLTYSQGIQRKFSRKTLYEFHDPMLDNLGYRAVPNKELYAQGTVKDNETFGYQEEWAELKYGINELKGDFRVGSTNSYANWHMSQFFKSLPTMGKDFIEYNSDEAIARVCATPQEDDVLVDMHIKQSAIRVMDEYSIPRLEAV